jgi:endonuclease/exonuclease/phosphatase family metal-dependent hydrolase
MPGSFFARSHDVEERVVSTDRRHARNLVACAAALLAAAVVGAACHAVPFRAPEPIKILVLNMHAGKDAAGTPNLDGIRALVLQASPDLVLLQEVDRGTARSGKVDQVTVLGDATRYDTAFAPSLSAYDGGEYGIAVLSRGGIGYHLTVPLPVSPVETRAGGSHEPRVALLVFAQVRGSSWRLIDTHLDPADGPARAQESAQLADLARQQLAGTTNLVAGGDLNVTPDNPVHETIVRAGLHDAWTECGSGDGFTYPADKPGKRIDYLFLSADVHCGTARVLDSAVSDHRPLLVTLKAGSR